MHVGEFAYLTSPGSKRLCIAPAGLTTSTHEISLHISLAKRFGFENRTSGHIQIIEDPDVCTATHVELFFRDQYLSRADMWQLMGRVQDTVVYHGQVMNYLGSGTAEVKQIYIAGREVDSAISNHPLTKPIFRSGSARYTILIEISTEMLEHWLEGDLMYERLISGFLPDLFNRWERSKVKHQVTVILFGRIRTVVSNKLHSSNGDLKAEDFFHILVSEVASTSWRDIMRSLKQAFNSSTLERSVSLAANSNMLEAIHLTAMDYADDQQDAHLLSTGTSIIAVTAGAGLFEADHTLLKQTTDLLVGNSIGVDIVALSPKPLHPVPLFQYDNHGSVEFALPHWVDISFWKGPHDVTNSTWSLTDSKAPVSDVALPFLRDGGWSQVEASMMDYYDQHVLGGSVVTTDDDLGKVKTATPSDAVGSVETMKGVNMPSTSTLEAAIDPAPETQAPSARPSVKEPLSRSKRERLPPHPLMQQGRKISVGPKGLAPSRGVASTTVSATYAQHEKDLWSLSSPSPSDHASGLTRALRASLARKPSQQSLISRTSEGDHEQSSRPINISATSEHRTGESGDPAGDVEQKIAATLVGNVLQNDSSLSTTPKAGIRYPRKASLDDSLDMLSPWVMLLNPCNPRRDNMRVASQYRKWQHVFPRAVSSGSFKWSSMCSPATLPLTAEYKPSATELDTLYNKKVRRHIISDSASLKDETARVLVERLIDMRLIKGFQIVAIRNSGSDQTYQSRNKPTLMALGRHYHEVQRLSDFEVQIVQYEPKSGIGSKEEEGQHYLTSYKPRLRIGIGVLTEPEISYHSDTPLSDWTALDEHILGLSPMPEAHVTFKVRLILIPVEIGAQTRLVGLSDDERHIEGIQRLTTTWQRQRYFSAEDQSRHASLTKSKASGPAADRDPNPLAIEYQTKDPSVVVNAHGPILSTQLEDGDLVPPLFAESEKHHSSNFDIAKLVKQMQELPPYGVEMRDRRWLTLTHLKCFRGDEMTTWLLSVFKDLDLREDAVTLGNELMHRGIFNHVRSKHKFRDGHYFYQISSSHRTTEYPDTQGLFSKAPWRSVPSTPATESMKSPMMRPVTGDSSSSSSKDTPSNAPTDQRQLLLSQVMQYNVDPQKKSDHLQIIDLHYGKRFRQSLAIRRVYS